VRDQPFVRAVRQNKIGVEEREIGVGHRRSELPEASEQRIGERDPVLPRLADDIIERQEAERADRPDPPDDRVLPHVIEKAGFRDDHDATVELRGQLGQVTGGQHRSQCECQKLVEVLLPPSAGYEPYGWLGHALS
jgi:hypothetical protein